MSSYYNTLRSTEMRGHVLVSNDTSTGGSTAFFECTGPAQIDGALTAPSVATTTLHPLGASTFTGNVTLPNMGSAGALSTGSLIQFAGTAFTLTLPTPTPGYMLYFINTNDTHTFTIASAGNLNYENPIDTLLINQSSFTVGIAAWGMLIADGTNWWVIYDSNLVSGISGLGLLTDLNAVLTCVVTAGPVYTFTSSASGVWKFNGPVSANNGLSVMNGLSADGVAVGSGGITVSAGGIDVISGSAIFPVASINPSNLNTAFNFLSGLTIQNNSAGTANRFAITDGTSTAHLAVATGTLQCDLGLVIPALALTGGDFFNNTGIHIGSSASSIAGLTIPSHGLNVTGGAIADSLTVGSGGMSTTGGLTIQNNSAGTANRLAITDGTSTSHLAVATGTLHCDLGLVIPSVLINTGGLAVTGGTTTDGLTVGSGGASTSFIGVTSSATTSIDTAGGVRAANGLNITAGTVAFPTGSAAQAAIANYGTFTSGISVTGGVGSFTSGISVPNATIPIAKITPSIPLMTPVAYGYLYLTLNSSGLEYAGNGSVVVPAGVTITPIAPFGVATGGNAPAFSLGDNGSASYCCVRVVVSAPYAGASIKGVAVATIAYRDPNSIRGWTIQSDFTPGNFYFDFYIFSGGTTPILEFTSFSFIIF